MRRDGHPAERVYISDNGIPEGDNVVHLHATDDEMFENLLGMMLGDAA